MGQTFFYDENSTEISNVIQSDEHIVNIVAPHPIKNSSILAVSGIDDTVKLYTSFESNYEFESPFFTGRIGEIDSIVEENLSHISSQGILASHAEGIGCRTS